jgi:broad specificity phosphatase PhoE
MVSFPGGESLEEVRVRAASAAERIVAAHGGESVLVSGHGHLNRVLLIHLLGWPRERFWKIEQPNAACWRLTIDPDPETGLRRVAGEPFESALV